MQTLFDYFRLGSFVQAHLQKNGFGVGEQSLKLLFSSLWPNPKPITCLVHLGNVTVHSQEFLNGTNTLVVGDETHGLVKIIDHGTSLLGPVEVTAKVEDGEDSLVFITMEISPIKPESEPLFGTIWMEDIRALGSVGKLGFTAAFGVQQTLIPDLRFPGNTGFMGTMLGFSLVMTTMLESECDSRFVRLPFFGSSDIVTPFGVSHGQVADRYPLAGRKYTRRPEGLSKDAHSIFSLIFQSQASILSQSAVREILASRNLGEEEITLILRILNGLSKKGEWLTRLQYVEDVYYIPTPKLLCEAN